MIAPEPQGCGGAPICVTTWSNGSQGGDFSTLVVSPHQPPDFSQAGFYGPPLIYTEHWPDGCIPGQCGPPVDPPQSVESPGTLALMGAVLLIGTVVLRTRTHA
jgi:hypothetical protein